MELEIASKVGDLEIDGTPDTDGDTAVPDFRNDKISRVSVERMSKATGSSSEGAVDLMLADHDAGLGAGVAVKQSINLLLFLQKQNLATAIYLFGLGTLLTGLGLKHMRISSHHDLVGALVTSLFLGRPWWSTTSPTCLPLSVFTITSDQHQCRIPPLL